MRNDKTYEDWENSLDQNYVRQLSPDAWDLTGSAFEAGQQSQQAKIDELQARVDRVVHTADESCGVSVAAFVKLNRILKGNEDEN